MTTLAFFGGQNVIQNEPGMIIGPIANVFGIIVDVIFNIVSNFTLYHSLGLSIILLTIIVRTLMLPLAIKQHKSMMEMQRLTPEVNKIRNKYTGKKDQKTQQQMNAEIQKLYSDNKVNPLGGCLPLLVQMPLFIGLSFIMRQSYRYVTQLGALFSQISQGLSGREIMPWNDYVLIMNELAVPLAPQGMLDAGSLDLSYIPDVNRILDAFSPVEWNTLFANIPVEHLPYFTELYGQITAIQTFFGMVLTESTGIGWPGILIPILAIASALLTSYIAMKYSVVTDERMRQQQRIMMIFMPIIMGAMTIGLPAGVGIFWITSSLYQAVQQLLISKKPLTNTALPNST
ncbi:MAG: YidC/Oxa1 family membrane protein insertase [Turicibacter sp.]|nr:YidC/Oxa1 family membrane protein insertase [Turicibacter sp.]